MKKIIAFVAVVLCLTFSLMNLTACIDEPENPQNGATTSNTSDANTDVTLVENIDVDLTGMSSTMVYAKVYDLLCYPQNYYGKTIKVRGTFQTSYWDSTQTRYYFVYVSDASACCAQGLEFVWNGVHSYPDDYPSLNSTIEIVGIYQTYLENGKNYYCLSVNEIEIL